jgi:hypothetical protein
MNDHKKFEILCALIVVGQASDADLRELNGHVEGCVDCQQRSAEFAQISAQALPLSAEKYCKPRSPRAMTARFVETARTQGIPLREPARLLPNERLSGLSGWNGHLAAALLLVAIVAGGISKSVHWRAPSTGTATTSKLEFPSAQSEPTRITQNRSTQQHSRRLPAPRRIRMSNAGSVESALTPTLPGVEQESGSLDSANRYQSRAPFNGQLFPTEAKSEHSRLLQSLERVSGHPWFDAPSLLLSTELEADSDRVGTAPTERRATLALMSLNFPPPVFSFGSDRWIQRDSPRSRSESIVNIDWSQVWLVRTESLRNSNDPSRSLRPGVLPPPWPFSKESKGEQP